MKMLGSFSLASRLILCSMFIWVNFVEAAGKPTPPPSCADTLRDSAIVYVDRESIKVADANGSNQVTLVSQRRTQFWSPSWSPDGKFIIFSSDLNGPGIYRLRIDRDCALVSAAELIIPITDVISAHPVWSPQTTVDGNYTIAYGDFDALQDRAVLYLVDVSVDGDIIGQPVKLSTHPLPGHKTFSEHTPSWSPDATRLAIRTHDGTVGSPTFALSGIEIITLGTSCGPNGPPVCEVGTRRDLIAELGSSPFGQYGASGPSWANTGNGIAVHGVAQQEGNADIWIITFDDDNPTNTQIVNLTDPTGGGARAANTPTWSPNDDQIMYQGWDYICQPQTNKERGWNLIVRNVDGTDFPAQQGCEEKMIVKGGRQPSWWRGN